MRSIPLGCVLFATLSTALGCGDQRSPTAPATLLQANRIQGVCPTRIDVIVHDEAGLRAALSASHPGEVIGVAGFFVINSDIDITEPGVRLTCVTPGSGLYATENVTDMLGIWAHDVSVDHLVLDATPSQGSPWYAQNDGISMFAKNDRFTNNTVTCSAVSVSSCAATGGGDGAVISDNYFEASNVFDGIHVQSGGVDDAVTADGARVERNTLIAITPSLGHRQGAIRTYNVSKVLIANNVISGPWSNGISPTRLNNSLIEGNRIDGAVNYGISLSWVGANLAPPGDFNNVFRDNRIAGSGTAGVWAYLGCFNRFIDNDLRGNAGNLGFIFPDSSGGNTVAGETEDYLIVDNGAYDCNGDGVNDPNVIRKRSGGVQSRSAGNAVTLNSMATLLAAPAVESIKRSNGVVLH